MKNEYIPGVCNIGPAEIRTRYMMGWFGLIAAIILWALLAWIGGSPLWRLVIIIPLFFSANGFLQGLMHFCAGFGMRGMFNFGLKVGVTDSVSQAEFRALDRKKAEQIFLYSLIVAIVVSVIGVYL
jgi:hypothetical protein